MARRDHLPVGGGPFVWKLASFLDGEPERIADYAKMQGWAFIAPKLVNESGKPRTADIRVALKVRELGVRVIPWAYVHPSTRLDELGIVAVELDEKCVMLNAEKEWKNILDSIAAGYMERARSLFGARAIILSTFAQESLHGTFPYHGFLTGNSACDAFGGQLYSGSPANQLREATATAAKYGVENCHALRLYKGDGLTDKAKIEANWKAVLPEAQKQRCFMWWEGALAVRDFPEALTDFTDSGWTPQPLPPDEVSGNSGQLTASQRAMLNEGLADIETGAGKIQEALGE